MSGGSYDYLYSKDVSDLVNSRSTLDDMASRLQGLGYANDAAKETLSILHSIEHFQTRMENRLSRLSGVWKAVEWWDSCDTGSEYLDDELKKYRAEIEP